MDYLIYSTGSSGSVAFTIVALIFAIIATILAFAFIVPDKKREKLNAIGKFLHDTVNFKYLIIEKILQALYIFTTAFIILVGFFMLFQTSYGRWLGGSGLLFMILGPILIRFFYELIMMTILLVKNVISINSKLKNQNDGSADGTGVFATPDMSAVRDSLKKGKEQVQQSILQATGTQTNNKPHFCSSCGSPLDANGNCPNCSK